MPNPSAISTSTARPEGRQGAEGLIVPFVRAAQRQTLPANIDVAVNLTASSQQVGVFEIPATGWLRKIRLLVTASGGDAGGASVAGAADSPWSIIDSIELDDPAGQPIFGPVSGYEFMLTNFAGGYEPQVNPAEYASYQAMDSDGNFRFELSVPVEASARDGYASLTNQDSSAAYRLRITLAGASQVYDTEPTTLPNVRIQGTMEVWTQPTPTNLAGQQQAIAPVGAGTIQFWTREVTTTVAGQNTIRVRRVGNLWRNLVLIGRDASGERVTTDMFPDPIRLLWDTLALTDEPLAIRLTKMEQMYDVAAPDGVIIYSYCDDLDGKPGFEMRNALLPTTPATRFEIQGSFGADFAGGSLTVLVNDILPAGGLS